MDSKRQAEIFKVFIKKMLRDKGLRFDKSMTSRAIGQEIKTFNEEAGLSAPLTVVEFCEIYFEIMQELVAEHFKAVEAKMAEARKKGE